MLGEVVDYQAEGEVESFVAYAGGQLGRVASGLRELVGRECGESAHQLSAAEHPLVILMGLPERDQ